MTQLPKRLRLTDPQRSTLAEIGKRLGPQSAGAGRVLGETGHDPCRNDKKILPSSTFHALPLFAVALQNGLL